MLIVTNQVALGIRRKGSLAGTRKTEEERHGAVAALVGGRVQGEDVVLDRHLVEEHGEDALLHLAGVLGAEDDHLLFSEVDGHGGARRHARRVAVGGELAGIVDDVVGLEVLELLARRPDEHVPHEERVVGARADDAHPDPVLLIPSRVAVDDVDAIPGVEVVDGTLAVDLPHLGSS